MSYNFENDGAGSHWNIKRVIKSNVFKGVRSFDDLQKNIAQIENGKTKGSAFEVFRKFFMTEVMGVKDFYYNDQIPLEILNKLKIPSDDKGIDCAYYDIDGTLVVGQDKYRTRNGKNLSWTELSTFFGLAEYAAHRSIFTNCKGVSKVVDQKDRWSLINDFTKIPEEKWLSIDGWLTGGRIIKTPKLQNRPHQTKAINSNVKMFKSGHDRLTNILPCGAGKTAIAIKTLKKLNPKIAVLYFPSVALVDQTEKEFVKHHLTTLHNYFAVTHDATVTVDMELYNDAAYDCDFPVTTNSDELKSKIDEAISKNKRILIFSTYQSANVITEACKGMSLDLGIFDEAHWTTGSRNKPYSEGLFDSNVKIDKRLFLTATPTWNEGCPTLFNSMDNIELYGERNISMSFREAIDKGIICDYELLTSEVESENINRDLINTSEVPVKGKLERSRLVSDCLTLKKAMNKHSFNKSFVFYNSCDPAKDFRNLFEKMNPEVECFYLDANTKAHKRKLILKSFSNAEKAILVNVDVLSEGIDCPNVDCVFFAQPKKSARTIAQAVGRALRPYPNKNKAYLLISTYVQKTDEEDISDALYESKNETIGNLVLALSQHDEQWVELLKQIIRQAAIGPRQTGDGGDSEINFPELRYFDVENSLLLRSILEVIPDHRTNFERMKMLYEKHGNWDVVSLKNIRKYENKSFLTFIRCLRANARNPNSVFHNYYPWLQENNYPWPLPKKEKVEVKKENKHLKKLLVNIEFVKNNLKSKRSASFISHWRNTYDKKSPEKQAAIKELFDFLDLRLEKITRKELEDRVFRGKLEEWASWRDDDFEPSYKKFTDGTIMAVWQDTVSQALRPTTVRSLAANPVAKRHIKALKDVGFPIDKSEEKFNLALAKIKRLKDHQNKHGNLENLPEDLKRFVAAVKAYYRRVDQCEFKIGPHYKKVFSEIDKHFKDFPYMPSKTRKIPTIKQIPTYGRVKCGSYRFSISFNGICRAYSNVDLKKLEERRRKVMEAGHHIDFPKPPPPNKGSDKWKKKREARKEAAKPYWEKHGWSESKIKILRDNYKTKTDKELSNTLLKDHTRKAISSQREKLGLFKK